MIENHQQNYENKTRIKSGGKKDKNKNVQKTLRVSFETDTIG